MPCNRSCHGTGETYPKKEQWDGGTIHRVSRPPYKQHTNSGRIANMFFVLLGWSWRAFSAPRSKKQTIIIGTDPVLAILCVFWWRLFRPNANIIHWCHDVYPDAAIADGLLNRSSWIVKTLNFVLRHAYRRCNVVADLGACMRELLQTSSGDQKTSTSHNKSNLSTDIQLDAGSNSANMCVHEMESVGHRTYITMPPWSLVETGTVSGACPEIRAQLFGDSNLALLYSGNLGRAHQFEPFLNLARRLKDDTAFCFAGRGPQFEKIGALAKAGARENVRLAGFAAESELQKRLSAADIHLVSLSPSWTGTVLPSKFFGSLAMGRPVLFAGSEHCAIAKWIRLFKVGWVLTDENEAEITEQIHAYATSCMSVRGEMNQRCLDVYTQHFSRSSQLAQWRSLIGV